MRVLVISAQPGSNTRSSESFVREVREVFSSMAGLVGSKVELTIRGLAQLTELVPPTPAPGAPADDAVVRRLCSFDSYDMILLDGDDNLMPWARASAPLLRIFHLCIASGKPLLGCSCAANLLSYLASVGPNPIAVRSGTLSRFDPPLDESARVDKRTGDLFCWSAEGGLWVPVGNVGSRCAMRHDANAGGTRRPSERNYSDGVRTCNLSNTTARHWLFKNVGPNKFPVLQRNEWSVRLPQGGASVITPTGVYPIRPLARSELGALDTTLKVGRHLTYLSREKWNYSARL